MYIIKSKSTIGVLATSKSLRYSGGGAVDRAWSSKPVLGIRKPGPQAPMREPVMRQPSTLNAKLGNGQKLCETNDNLRTC